MSKESVSAALRSAIALALVFGQVQAGGPVKRLPQSGWS